jgi:hypothetical protein
VPFVKTPRQTTQFPKDFGVIRPGNLSQGIGTGAKNKQKNDKRRKRGNISGPQRPRRVKNDRA